MKTNADGSLTLYIQNKSPGADKESNWLPAPNDTIYLVMRLYWPKTNAAFDPAGGRRDMAAARHKAGFVDQDYSCARVYWHAAMILSSVSKNSFFINSLALEFLPTGLSEDPRHVAPELILHSKLQEISMPALIRC